MANRRQFLGGSAAAVLGAAFGFPCRRGGLAGSPCDGDGTNTTTAAARGRSSLQSGGHVETVGLHRIR